jgi:PAS domain S-box-containing protein
VIDQDLPDSAVGAAVPRLDPNRALFEMLASVGLCSMILSTDGSILFANEFLASLTGWTTEELIGRDWFGTFRSAEGEAGRVRFDEIVSGRLQAPPQNQSRIQTRSGQFRTIAWSSTALRDADGTITAVASIGEDVTEQVRLRAEQEALLAERERLVALLDNSPSFIALIDLEFRFTYVNPAGRAMVGIAASTDVRDVSVPEVLGPGRWEEFHEDGLARVLAGETLRGESRLRNRITGEGIPVERSVFVVRDPVSQAPVGFGAIQNDLRERHKAEAATRQRDELIRAIIDTIPLAFVAIDRDFRVELWSPAAERMFGWTAAEIIGRFAGETFMAPLSTGESDPPPIDDDARNRLRRVLDGATVSAEPAIRMTKDGRGLPVELYATPRRDADGQVIGAIGLIVDVSDRRSLEEQVRRSQKLDAVGQMAAAVAHDYNNVLTAISGYAELLSFDLDASDIRRESVDEIRLATERAAALTRQLLTFARKQPSNPVVLELGGVVDGIAPLVKRLLSASVGVTITAEMGDHRVVADRGQLEQLIVNMAVNARDAMPDGGEIRIETSTVIVGAADVAAGMGLVGGASAVADIGPAAIGGSGRAWVQLAITDSGVGIDEAIRSQIFEPFFTTKPEGQGTGLGLATCDAIVRGAGGWIRVESTPGLGTTFRVFLPHVVATTTAAHDPARESALVAHGHGERILVVEDDFGVRALTVEILRRQGYDVSAADSPTTAEAAAEAMEDGLDLLIVDVVLPEMRGPELAARIREVRPVPAVLFVSGYADQEALGIGRLEAADAFLGKPFGPDSLTRKVQSVLDRAASLRSRDS